MKTLSNISESIISSSLSLLGEGGVSISTTDVLKLFISYLDDVHVLGEPIFNYRTITDLADSIYKHYNEICYKFDESGSMMCFDKSFAFDRDAQSEDSIQVLILVLLLYDSLLKNDNASEDGTIRILLQLVSRYMMIFRPSDIGIEERIIVSSLSIIAHYQWNTKYIVYLRIFALNLFDRISLLSKSHRDVLSKSLNSLLSTNNDSKRLLELLMEEYLAFLNKQNKIELLTNNLSYVCIYKKRFGFIHCKKIVPISNNSGFPFTYVALSPAFKYFKEMPSYSSSKVILFRKDEFRRSREYKAPEDSFFFNTATLKYE